MLAALEAKVPKLSLYSDARRILLLEKDAIAGTIESQFEKLPMTPSVESMLRQIDEIWGVNTVSLEKWIGHIYQRHLAHTAHSQWLTQFGHR